MARIAAALLLALLALGTGAAEPCKYAVLSLIGDEMLVVGASSSTGQRLDRNPRNYVRLEDPVIDKSVLLTANEALRGATGTDPVLLFAHERAMYALCERAADEGAGTAKLMERIRPLVQGTHATHLMLFTKARREARMQLLDTTLGSGMIEGVGFYVDPNTQLILRDSGQTAMGYIGAFAYFDAVLLDLGRAAIVAEQRVAASRTTAAPSSRVTEVWSGIPAHEKMRMLQSILREEVARAVPLLIKESN